MKGFKVELKYKAESGHNFSIFCTNPFIWSTSSSSIVSSSAHACRNLPGWYHLAAIASLSVIFSPVWTRFFLFLLSVCVQDLPSWVRKMLYRPEVRLCIRNPNSQISCHAGLNVPCSKKKPIWKQIAPAEVEAQVSPAVWGFMSLNCVTRAVIKQCVRTLKS